MQNIEPHAMACFTQTGTTDDDHKQVAFHGCILFDETETGSIKAAVSALNRYFTNRDRLDGKQIIPMFHLSGSSDIPVGKKCRFSQ